MRTRQLQLLGVGLRFKLPQGIIRTRGRGERRATLDGAHRAGIVIWREIESRKGLVAFGRRRVRREILRNGRGPITADGLERRPATLVGRLEVQVIATCGDL